jgi:hypothetical protein
MVQNDNSKAEFGDINKTFMYSFKWNTIFPLLINFYPFMIF